MPTTSSAKKALRVSFKKKVFNQRRKNVMQDTIKEVRKLVSQKKISEAQALLPKAYKAIDKALKVKYIKKNTAARKKSRLAKLIEKNKGQVASL